MSTPPIPRSPDFYPKHTIPERNAKYEEPKSDGYMEITLVVGSIRRIEASDLCEQPTYSDGVLQLLWHTGDEKRRHAQEIIPMSLIESIVNYPPSTEFYEALDRYSLQETGMTYDEAREVSRQAAEGARGDQFRGFLADLGINPDDIQGFSG